MAQNIKLHDVVALTEDVAQYRLQRGQVGTVVELHSDGHYEVEFCDESGRTYALVPLAPRQLMVLHYHPARAA